MPRSRPGGSNNASGGRRNAGRICGRSTRTAHKTYSRRPRPAWPRNTGTGSEASAMINKLIEGVEKEYLKKEKPKFEVGDTVDVHTRIIEGEKERIQVFSCTVIMLKGRGTNETFTVRRIVNTEGVERIFPIQSPFIS